MTKGRVWIVLKLHHVCLTNIGVITNDEGAPSKSFEDSCHSVLKGLAMYEYDMNHRTTFLILFYS